MVRWLVFALSLAVLCSCWRKEPAAARYDEQSAAANQEGQAPLPRSAGEVVQMDGHEVRIAGLRFTAPKNWTRERVPVSFVLAQFSLPRAKGDSADAQLTITSIESRGSKTLKRLEDKLNKKSDAGDSVERLQIGGNSVIVTDNTGDSGDPSDPFSQAPGEGLYRELNAMVFAGDKIYSISCTGPQKTVSERLGEFRAFLQSMKGSHPAG
ncbi:MAG: hypothetical protein HY537_10010 [Deltaproteobacteria bacterium]|nr:hypothetical protein [Deltaproteobacteria bacterium]